MAPILSFTAEEVWNYMPRDEETPRSVHLSSFSGPPDIRCDKEFVAKWEMLIELKGEVSKALETSRKEKVIGHSLDACVQILLPEAIRSQLRDNLDELMFVFIVSRVQLMDSLDGSDGVYVSDAVKGMRVKVQPAEGQKCERCWNYFVDEVGRKEHPTVCLRCVGNLQSAGLGGA